MPAAVFGIENDAANLVVNLLILFLVVLWLALVAWTYFDAKRRIEDDFLVVCAAAASFAFPFLGPVVYSILRPPEFLNDQHERELEIKAAELRLRHLEEQSCPSCEHPIERNYLRCPNCKARIKDPCESCGKPIDPRWSVCPYCETPVRRSAPPERQAPPRRRTAKPATRSSRAQPQAAEAEAPTARGDRERKPSKSGQSRSGSGSRTADPPARKPRTSG
jgi:Double zinc ribbon